MSQNGANTIGDADAGSKLWGSSRLAVAVCVFLASVQTSMLRDNLGIAMVCMSAPGANLTCGANDAAVPALPWFPYKKNCEFEWDKTTQGRMLGAFLYGYISTTMVGGFAAEKYGARIPFMCGGVGNAVFHLLCPTAVLVHKELFFALRLLQGMTSGLLVGPFFQLFSAWLPEAEISTLAIFSFSGFSLGTILTYPISGQLCDTNINGFGGWPLIFYVPAGISILFILVWCRYLHDGIENHPRISEAEYHYLLENIDIEEEHATIPWKSICTSMPFITYTVCYGTFLWNVFSMMNNMPMFMRTMLNINSKEIGTLFCVPLVSAFIARLFNGKTYPIIKNSLGWSNTVCRKIYFVFGTAMVVATLYSIVYTRDVTKWHVVAVLTINMVLGDFAYSGGFYPTLLELAPNYAGLLSGISTFVAYLFACPATLVNSSIVKHNTKEEWNTVLMIIVVMLTFSLLMYLIFGSASLQKWAQPGSQKVIMQHSVLRSISHGGVTRTMSLRHPTHAF